MKYYVVQYTKVDATRILARNISEAHSKARAFLPPSSNILSVESEPTENAACKAESEA